MKKLTEWVNVHIISNRKTMAAGFIFLLIFDWLCWNKIPYLANYVCYIAAGVIGLASTRRCWGDKRKLQTVCCIAYAFCILLGGGGVYREIREFVEGPNTVQNQINVDTGAIDVITAREPASSAVSSGRSPWRTECGQCNGLRTCGECYGDGDFYCTYCLGGRCIACNDGRVLVGFDASGNARYRDCPDCNGGRCNKCGGNGRIDCTFCVGGKCPVCHGTGYQ